MVRGGERKSIYFRELAEILVEGEDDRGRRCLREKEAEDDKKGMQLRELAETFVEDDDDDGDASA